MKFSVQTIVALTAAVSSVTAIPLEQPAINSPLEFSKPTLDARDGLLPGLNEIQSSHAKSIMGVVSAQGLGKQGCLCGITTALTESTMAVLANNAAPESLNFQHDGMGADNDSVGLFQQRVIFYKNVQCNMDAACSSQQFFDVMKGIAGWQTMPIGQLCQAIQRSEKPDAYNYKIAHATQICAAGGFP